jgi:hypothetical protein
VANSTADKRFLLWGDLGTQQSKSGQNSAKKWGTGGAIIHIKQLVAPARSTTNQEVAGSNPAGRANNQMVRRKTSNYLSFFVGTSSYHELRA